jgi:hypothetical protein
MAAPERRVRHLRLVAGHEHAARAALSRIEDALRCAALPDAGARLLLVRRLALGPLQRQATSQAIARTIEARFEASGTGWTAGDEGDAALAERVVFASALHARTALSLRLLRRLPCSAWYWPLAVPEFRRGLTVSDNLCAMALALARSQEAPAALPAWAAQVVGATGHTVVQAMVPERVGQQLIAAAGLDSSPKERRQEDNAFSGRAEHAAPWLQTLLVAASDGATLRTPAPGNQAADENPAPSASGIDPSRGAGSDPASPPAPHGRHSALAHAASTRAAQPPRTDAATAARSAHESVPDDRAAPSRARAALQGDQTARVPWAIPGSLAAPFSSQSVVPRFAVIDAAPTTCAGLLFVLPVLESLGLPEWPEHPEQRPDWTRAVLAAVLWRLQVPQQDPAWTLALPVRALARCEAPAPRAWKQPALRSLLGPRVARKRALQQRARRQPRSRSASAATSLATALAGADSSGEQAALWLTALRRWLRRMARIGLASLVLRPGWISLTPTHVDVFFRLCDAELKIRRLGLDIDPGWVSWFGRVASYHYGTAPVRP